MLPELGISEEDLQQTPAAVRTALSALWQQFHLLSNRCAVYEQQVEKLQAQVAAVESLRLEVAELRERLGQNSNNSSKPPSSDPPSTPRYPKRERSGKKPGGQPGHPGSRRQLKELNEVDQVVEVKPVSCTQCGQLLLGQDPQPARHQVSEIPPIRAEVIEYRRHTLKCLACGTVNQAAWPTEMPHGSFGPRVQAIIGYLTGRLGASHRDVIEVLKALYGLEVSLGSVSAIQQQVSAALAQPIKTAENYAGRQAIHHVDETGWRERNKQHWLWIHATPAVTIFKLLPGRGSNQAQEVIGKKFSGVVSTDRYAAYNWITEERRQLCWAHLKRDFQAMVERGDESAAIGQQLLAQVKEMFGLWYQVRDGTRSRAEFQSLMEPIQISISRLLHAGTATSQKKTQSVCRNVLKREAALWSFVKTPNVEPTNNTAERSLRRAVIWRRKSFGTQSQAGSRFVERILTAVMTLRQQGRDVLEYLVTACHSLGQSDGHSVCLLPEPS